MLADRVLEQKKALLYSKEHLNIAQKLLEKRSVDVSQMYLLHAFIYFKLAAVSRYESSRISMKSNAFDNLKISLEVRVYQPARKRELLGQTA
jgi:hypothetical protein